MNENFKIDCCKNCAHHDPFDGEETIWFKILKNDPSKVRCGLSFTYEETVIGPLGHLVGKNQKCSEFTFPEMI